MKTSTNKKSDNEDIDAVLEYKGIDFVRIKGFEEVTELCLERLKLIN